MESRSMVPALETADFEKMTTRVRIHPETVLKFDNGEQVTLQNPGSSKAIQIQYDIMLILYPMVRWVTVEELCKDWPSADQTKIKGHLKTLYEHKIIITDESELPDASQSRLIEMLGNAVVINVDNHVVMMRDSARMTCFRSAIQKAVTPDSVVLDLGSGSGILSFFAAQAGASKVYAVEKRPDMVRLSKQLSKANGLDGQITHIEAHSQMLDPSLLHPKPTLLIAEILGNAIFEEKILEFTLDARDRLLAPGAKLIPASLEVMGAAFDAGEITDKALEVEELERMYGLNLEMLKLVQAKKPVMRLERFSPKNHTLMCDPISMIHLDFQTLTSAFFNQTFEFKMAKAGFVNLFCVYFRAHLDETTVLTNSPWAPTTHWGQMVFHFPQRREVQTGETLTMQLVYDGGLMLDYQD